MLYCLLVKLICMYIYLSSTNKFVPVFQGQLSICEEYGPLRECGVLLTKQEVDASKGCTKFNKVKILLTNVVHHKLFNNLRLFA